MYAYNLFIPLFNIEVEEKLLRKDFINQYKILPSKDITLEPQKYVFATDSYTRTFIKDITLNGPNKWLLHPYAKFVLYKKVLLQNDDEKTIVAAKETYKKEVDKILLSLRLVSNGFCQVNNLYMLANGQWRVLTSYASYNLDNKKQTFRVCFFIVNGGNDEAVLTCSH